MVNTERYIRARLSKSGKAIMIHDEHGNTWMSSVQWMQMLLNGGATNNMIKLNHMGDADTSRFNSDKSAFNKGKVRATDADPLSLKGAKEREQGKVKIKDDW